MLNVECRLTNYEVFRTVRVRDGNGNPCGGKTQDCNVQRDPKGYAQIKKELKKQTFIFFLALQYYYNLGLDDQHRVAIRVKVVFLFDCYFICFFE